VMAGVRAKLDHSGGSERIPPGPENELVRLEAVIREVGLPTEIPDLNVDDITQAMKHDKKVLEGKIRFILPKTIGKAYITDEVAPDLLREVMVGSSE